MKVHLWEAYNPKKISVNITNELKEKIRILIKDNIYSLANKIKITPARLYEYFIWKKAPIPLTILISISKIFKLSLIEIEKNVIMYKQMYVPNKNSVKNPKLPIEINPYFTSIISNLYFDGSVPEDGKGTYYNQKDEKIMEDFIKKIKYVFGDVQYSLGRDHRGVLKCRVPRIIGEVCKHVYSINSFGSFNSRMARCIFHMSEEHKIAFILSAIVDEGSITYDGDIQFGVSNKELCRDVQQLCEEIGLNPGMIQQKRNNEHYYFYIKNKKMLLSFLNLFKRKHPFINIGFKEDRIRHFFKIKKFPGKNTREGANERKNKILLSLTKEGKTINELCLELFIPPRSLRRHLKLLTNEGRVSRSKKSSEYIYYLG